MKTVVKIGANGRLATVVILVFCVSPAGRTEQPEPAWPRNIRQVALDGNPDRLEVSRDGSTVAIASESILKLLNSKGELIRRWDQEQRVVDLDLTTSGRLVAVANGSPEVVVYDAFDEDGHVHRLRRDDAADFLRADGQLSVALMPDGKKLISTGERVRVFVSDVASEKWEHIMFVKYDRSDVFTSPDGKHVAMVGKQNPREISGHVTMFLVRKGLQPLWTRWHDGSGRATRAVFSPDSSAIATHVPGDGVRVWKLDSGELVKRIKTDEGFLGVTFVSNENHLLLVNTNGMSLHQISTGEVIAEREPDGGQWTGFAAAIDGRLAVTSTDKRLDFGR